MSFTTFVQSISIPAGSSDVALSVCLIIDGKPYFAKADVSAYMQIDSSVIVPTIQLTISNTTIDNLKLTSGEVKVESGSKVTNIQTSTGDVTADHVEGWIRTSTGDVDANTVGQSITTSTGDVFVNTVHGSISTSTGDVFKDGRKQARREKKHEKKHSQGMVISGLHGLGTIHQTISPGGISFQTIGPGVTFSGSSLHIGSTISYNDGSNFRKPASK